ncbi:hypothetical protein D3C71_1736820 [compost metagenome]
MAPLLRPVVPLVYRMAAKSSALRGTGVWLSPWCAARSSRLPVRSSPSVKTCCVPSVKAILLTQPKLPGLHTTTAGSALPTKYSISALWYAVLSGKNT